MIKVEGWLVPVKKYARQSNDERYIEMVIADGFLAVSSPDDDGGTWGLKETPESIDDFDALFHLISVAYFGRLESTDSNGVTWALWERILDIYGFSFD